MILTCPQCETRYLLPALALGEAGKSVRCSHCQKVWHQDPESEERSGDSSQGDEQDEAMDITSIPEGVKPLPDEAPRPKLYKAPQKKEKTKLFSQKQLLGFSLAVVLGLSVAMPFLMSAKKIMRSWPASTAFYKSLGYEIEIPGEGLVFDQLKSYISDNGDQGATLTLEGAIINLTAQEKSLPFMEVAIRNVEGDELARWVIPPPVSTLEKEGQISFKSVYEWDIENDIKDGHVRVVNVRFLVGVPDVEVDLGADTDLEHVKDDEPETHAP